MGGERIVSDIKPNKKNREKRIRTKSMTIRTDH